MQTKVHMAEYKKTGVPDYDGNPLIECLPPIMDGINVVEKLSVYPDYSDSERFLDKSIRMHMVSRVFQVFQPLSYHLDLEARLSQLVRRSYIMRNPITEDEARNTNSQLSGFAFLGVSGSGKSSSVQRILRGIYSQQVITHSVYKQADTVYKLAMYQVVWLKIEATESLKTLAIDFFNQVDALLGTDYVRIYGNPKRSLASMLPALATVARQINLGMLFIDEIQGIRTLRSNANRILNFYVSLTNTIGVPVIFIGTPAAMTLFKEFKISRRSSGMGDFVIDRLSKGLDWDLLVDAIEPYQFTRNRFNIQDISDALYEESQGIIDVCIKLFAISQSVAIKTGKEFVDATLIKEVAASHFKLIRKYINALKSGNIRLISQYEDISTLMIEVEQDVVRNAHQADVESKVKEIKMAQLKKSEMDKTTLRAEVLMKLEKLGEKSKRTEKILDQILKVIDGSEEVSLITLKVLESSKTKNKKQEDHISVEGDIRAIVAGGKEKGISVLDSLIETGLVKYYSL